MEAINDNLHALAKHLFGCIHEPFIHILAYKVNCLTYVLRYTTEKGFDCSFLAVRQHPQNDRLCLHTSGDDGDKIPMTFLQRYLVETNHIKWTHVIPMDFSLDMTINNTHDGFITDILFHTHILHRTIDQAQQYLYFIGLGKGTPWGIPRELLGGSWVPSTMETLITLWTKTNKGFPAQNR